MPQSVSESVPDSSLLPTPPPDYPNVYPTEVPHEITEKEHREALHPEIEKVNDFLGSHSEEAGNIVGSIYEHGASHVANETGYLTGAAALDAAATIGEVGLATAAAPEVLVAGGLAYASKELLDPNVDEQIGQFVGDTMNHGIHDNWESICDTTSAGLEKASELSGKAFSFVVNDVIGTGADYAEAAASHIADFFQDAPETSYVDAKLGYNPEAETAPTFSSPHEEPSDTLAPSQQGIFSGLFDSHSEPEAHEPSPEILTYSSEPETNGGIFAGMFGTSSPSSEPEVHTEAENPTWGGWGNSESDTHTPPEPEAHNSSPSPDNNISDTSSHSDSESHDSVSSFGSTTSDSSSI